MPFVPDSSQKKAIELQPDARAIVEAGPGFGKTDVACARVAGLTGNGVEPTRILLLSFTRTAVREMRARIKELARKSVNVAGIEIKTLDSFTWRLRTNLTEVSKEATRGWGYEESINEVVRMLEQPSDELMAELARFRHVFIDEAQDLVGARAQLVTRLLNLLPEECGYTVFMDPAQAIYGWADDGEGAASGVDFMALIEELDPQPERLVLKELHRSSDKKLKTLVLEARSAILGKKPAKKSRAEVVRKTIEDIYPLLDAEPLDIIKKLGAASDSALVLFRTRFEAMRFSGNLASEDIPHRLRFGSLPPVVAPWVAMVLNRVEGGQFNREAFDAAWSQLGKGSRWTKGWDPDHAWSLLRRMGAKGNLTVSSAAVAERLAMSSPPDDLALKEVGSGGPIVGTIHGSKGREAEVVVACLPREKAQDEDEGDAGDEEARVLYVAVTRARSKLHVLDGGAKVWGSRSNRVWRKSKAGNIQVEIGKAGDLDVASVATGAIQKRLEAYDGRVIDVSSRAVAELEWKRLITLEDETPLGFLTSATGAPFVQDLWEVARAGWGDKARPGNWIGHFKWFDVTTVAVRADSPILKEVEPVYRKSRVWLAPVFSGLGVMTFPRRA